MMHQASRKTTKGVGGIDLYYETYAGDKPATPIFFVHGVGGDLDAWQHVREKLVEKGFSGIAMDLRGHGKSGHPYHFKEYRLQNFIEDAIAILDAEKIDRVILVGHSLGAVLTSHIALHHPERIEKLILISSSYIPPPYFKIPGMFFLFNMLAAISLPPIRPGHSTYPPGKHHKDIEVFGLIRTILRNSLRSYILSSKEILKSDIGTSLHNIQVPTLIISGNKDTIFPTPISLHIRSEIKDSALKVIDGGNHVVILNNAEEVARDISGFLGGAASEAPLS